MVRAKRGFIVSTGGTSGWNSPPKRPQAAVVAKC
jgi:hypothetical protein